MSQVEAGSGPRDIQEVEIPYEAFLAERQKIVDARQRTQQRFDQIVSAGAAGALVLSITFLERIAPSPDPTMLRVLIFAWLCLLVSLGASFFSHWFSRRAFESYLNEFDRAYREKRIPEHENLDSKASRWLDDGAVLFFVAGIILLAWFAIANLPFTEVNG